MKPMLACSTQPDINQLSYPLYASTKLDGIRCVVINGKVLSRTLKPIPNLHIQNSLSSLPFNLDGELMVEGDFSSVESAVMSRDGKPDFTYRVFDCIDYPAMPYASRYGRLLEAVQAMRNDLIVPLHQQVAKSAAEVQKLYAEATALGYEGLILRAMQAPYKYGRSTLKQEWMLKLKPVEDTEAFIIGYEEMMHNDNEAELSNTGGTVRSKHQAGLTPSGKLGAFVCQDKDGFTVSVGSGFTMAQRLEYWEKRFDLLGKQITFKFQERTPDMSYRFPVFKGFRSTIDV